MLLLGELTKRLLAGLRAGLGLSKAKVTWDSGGKVIKLVIGDASLSSISTKSLRKKCLNEASSHDLGLFAARFTNPVCSSAISSHMW